jgi:hypothetical protein
MASRFKTTTEERDIVLHQNEELRRRFRISRPDMYQRLRRCCICLQPSCADLSECREEFARWAEHKWDAAVEVQLRADRVELST